MKNLQDLISELNSRRMRKIDSMVNSKHKSKYAPDRYISAWLEDDIINTNGELIKALVIILRTHGCSWSRAKPIKTYDSTTNNSAVGDLGGCCMCGYINDCLPEALAISEQDLVRQFQSALNKYKETNFELIKIFTSGSFFDDNEIPPKVQISILDLVNNSDIQKLIVESRPEYVTSEKLEKLKSHFKGQLEIALGLESCNDKILKYSINKGFKFNDYKTAVKVAREHDASIKTYLLLKPPFLTERDAIIDTLTSLKELRKSNLTDCISINPVHIQKFSVVEYLFNHHDYRPPWLWSLLDVLIQGNEILSLGDSDIRLLSSPTGGGYNRGVHNCGKCDNTILKAIEKFSLRNDPGPLKKLHCTCKDAWQDIIDLENMIRSPLEPLKAQDK